MEKVLLLGIEEAGTAARTIRVAAEEMRRAAAEIEAAFREHKFFLEDWLTRFEEVLKRGGKNED